MIEHVVPGNIDDRILSRAVSLLNEGGIAALPTDTSWSLACSLKSREGIKKLRRLSGVRDEGHFTLLCSDISQFGEFCSLDNSRFRLIKRLTPGPYVFVLNTLLGTEKSLGLKRREIGVRLPNHQVPIALIKALDCPLYSITAKKNMEENDFEEDSLFEGGWELEAIPSVDVILDPGEDRIKIYSTVLDLKEGEVKLIRLGAGEWPV
jgi:tRNA threonylcarbamoyl adenosine modification protein (Sua5/YciO/YrdC/YwlC family)